VKAEKQGNKHKTNKAQARWSVNRYFWQWFLAKYCGYGHAKFLTRSPVLPLVRVAEGKSLTSRIDFQGRDGVHFSGLRG